MGRTTKTLLGNKAREAILIGVNEIYSAIRRTLGPYGENGLIYRTFNRGSRITNDGFANAEVIEPKDPFVRMAAQAFKEGISRTNKKVGDGTTATGTIGGKLFNDVFLLLSEGSESLTAKKSSKTDVMSLKRRIRATADLVKGEILKKAKKIETIEELERIAIISIENADLGKLVAKMAWDVGVDGFIDVTEGYKGEIETDVIKGMRFPAKVAHKAFVTHKERFEMVAEDCPVFITNYKLDNIAEFGNNFREINSKATSKLIIIAPSFSENVLKAFAETFKGGFFLYPVATSSLRTEQFEDLATYCGAKFLDKDKGMKLRNLKSDYLGFLEKLIVKDNEVKEDAVATGGAGTKTTKVDFSENEAGFQEEQKEPKISPIIERIKILKGQLLETKQDQFKALLERRIAAMGSAVGVIRVGGPSDAEIYYQKLKIEDAVYACKAALRGGYVKGGGLCLKEIADTLPDTDILKAALLAPYEQIQNSIEGGVEIGTDIIDPTEAVYYSVEYSTSVVANLATVGIITVEEEDPIHGEGEFAIAKMIGELALIQKRQYGFLKENEEESERDRLIKVTGGIPMEDYLRKENG